MPQIVRTTSTREVKLSSAPPDGYVKLRKLSYLETLHRQDLAGRLEANSEDGENVGSMRLSPQNEQLRTYDFSTCIVEHNLQGENDRLLNLGSSADLALIPPEVGREIAEAIDTFLNEDGPVGNPTTPSSERSLDVLSETPA